MPKPNKSVIIKVAKANLKAERVKNFFAGSVIVLVAFLLTIVMTYGYNSFTKMKNESDFQAMFYNVDNQKIDQINKVEEINKSGLYKEVGSGRKDGLSLSILYTDQTMMELSNASIVQGNFPIKQNEIAIEKDYISAIKKTVNIGDQITVEFRNKASKEIQTNEFVISGFLQTTASGDDNRIGYNAIVSKAFISTDMFLSKGNYSVALSIKNADSYSNEELKSKIENLGQEIGISKKNIQINYVNVDTNNPSSTTTISIACIMLVIVMACWLVIYNIFYISISKQIKQYGQLRALGATRKQLKKIIFCEGRDLSLKYIPVGVFLGCLISWLIDPSIWLWIPDILFAILAALFTYLTVRISLNAPAKFAARISPIEAIRNVGASTSMKKGKKSSRKLTPLFLAILNVLRNKKKTMLTLLSLIFSGILFISLATLMNSVDPVARARSFFPNGGQFDVQINSELFSEKVTSNVLQSKNQLSDSLKKSILSISGVDNVISHQNLEATVNKVTSGDGDTIVGIKNISMNNIQLLRQHLLKGKIPEVESSDEEHILMNSDPNSELGHHGIRYDVGDKIQLIIDDGKREVEHEFTIIGEINNKEEGASFFLPYKAMQSVAGFNPNIRYEIIVNNSNEQQVKKELQNLISEKDTLKLVSFSEVVEIYKKGYKILSIAIYSFIIFIALFSIINLMNTIITTITSRKVEIGIMQAIGMDRKQLVAMLGYETGFLIVGSFTIALIVGNLIGYWISKVLGNIGGMSFIRYQFPLSAILLYVLAILLVQLGVIQFVRSSTSKQTIVERLK